MTGLLRFLRRILPIVLPIILEDVVESRRRKPDDPENPPSSR